MIRQHRKWFFGGALSLLALDVIVVLCFHVQSADRSTWAPGGSGRDRELGWIPWLSRTAWSGGEIELLPIGLTINLLAAGCVIAGAWFIWRRLVRSTAGCEWICDECGQPGDFSVGRCAECGTPLNKPSVSNVRDHGAATRVLWYLMFITMICSMPAAGVLIRGTAFLLDGTVNTGFLDVLNRYMIIGLAGLWLVGAYTGATISKRKGLGV